MAIKTKASRAIVRMSFLGWCTMAAERTTLLQVTGLGKRKMEAVVRRARHLGMTPKRYLRHLLDEDLAISQRAKNTSFEELLGPGRATDENEIDRLVDAARTAYHEAKRRRG
jgi:hypothetical protein